MKLHDNPWVRVSFRGGTYWVPRATLDGKEDGPMALDRHIDAATGELADDADGRDSYAHIYADGTIVRFGDAVGHVREVRELPVT